jgi:hypothetical protein
MLSEKRKDGKRGDGRQVLKSKDIGGELKCWQGSRTTVSLPERPGRMDDRYWTGEGSYAGQCKSHKNNCVRRFSGRRGAQRNR